MKTVLEMDGGAGLQQHECPQCYWTVHLKWVRGQFLCVFYIFFLKKKKNNRFCSWISDLHGVQQYADYAKPPPGNRSGQAARRSEPHWWPYPPGPCHQNQVRLPNMLSGATAPKHQGFAAEGLSTRSKKMVAQASTSSPEGKWVFMGWGMEMQQAGSTCSRWDWGPSDVTRSGGHGTAQLEGGCVRPVLTGSARTRHSWLLVSQGNPCSDFLQWRTRKSFLTTIKTTLICEV